MREFAVTRRIPVAAESCTVVATEGARHFPPMLVPADATLHVHETSMPGPDGSTTRHEIAGSPTREPGVRPAPVAQDV